jgi:thymidylate synthase (FAD)
LLVRYGRAVTMIVDLIDHMGSDLTVVNAARVSFNKESKWKHWPTDDNTDNIKEYLEDKDEKLINYLARHNHWTPFGHCSAQFRITAPIFVARQLDQASGRSGVE